MQAVRAAALVVASAVLLAGPAHAAPPAAPPAAAPASTPAPAPGAASAPAQATPAASASVPADPDPTSFVVGGLKLGMTPAEVTDALHGHDFDTNTIRRPTADGHETFVAAVLLRSKAVKTKPATGRQGEKAASRSEAGKEPDHTSPVAVPAEQIAVVFSQFGGNRATEILRVRRYGPDELVGDAKLRAALIGSYGLTLPPKPTGPDAPDTLTATRAFPPRSVDSAPAANAAVASVAPLLLPPEGAAPPSSPAAPGQTQDQKLPDCAAIADHNGFDMALLASDPGMEAMPLWTGFIPGCAVTISISAHRAPQDPNAYDFISQHLIDQSAALSDLAALRTARQTQAAADAKARQEAAAGHAPSL